MYTNVDISIISLFFKNNIVIINNINTSKKLIKLLSESP